MANANPQYPTPEDPITTVGFQNFVNNTPRTVYRNRLIAAIVQFPWGLFLLYLIVAAIIVGGGIAALEVWYRGNDDVYSG